MCFFSFNHFLSVCVCLLQAALWWRWRAQWGGAGRCSQWGAGLASPHLHSLDEQHEETGRRETKVPQCGQRHPGRHHGGQVSLNPSEGEMECTPLWQHNFNVNGVMRNRLNVNIHIALDIIIRNKTSDPRHTSRYYPQEVLLAQFILYVHKSGIKVLCHFCAHIG